MLILSKHPIYALAIQLRIQGKLKNTGFRCCGEALPFFDTSLRVIIGHCLASDMWFQQSFKESCFLRSCLITGRLLLWDEFQFVLGGILDTARTTSSYFIFVWRKDQSGWYWVISLKSTEPWYLHCRSRLQSFQPVSYTFIHSLSTPSVFMLASAVIGALPYSLRQSSLDGLFWVVIASWQIGVRRLLAPFHEFVKNINRRSWYIS